MHFLIQLTLCFVWGRRIRDYIQHPIAIYRITAAHVAGALFRARDP